ncbi:MAG: hypothetical protein EPN62_05730 [Candidimonas sp.]|nr:MAG: hypothetical protein EPN77_16785 [Candidimonas sp.]TAM24810.1 MAG: hypothetical protein EPN62_05730 [Candidimonas sp.]
MKKVFDAPGGDFEACRDAEAWCEARDIAVGTAERDQPRGLIDHPCIIAKWSNLRPHERARMNGTMSGDMRYGPVTIELDGNEDDYPVIPERYRE